MAGTVARREYIFDLFGGRLCLDFVNTLNGSRATGHTEEKLTSYADLVSWGRQTGVITERVARRLLREAAERPGEASAVLEDAISLREAIYGILAAAINERPPEKADLATLNAALSNAMRRSEVVKTADGFDWDWSTAEGALDPMLWPVARSAAELLTSDDLTRTRECGGDECTWLFLDTSKNRSRRWCDMRGCGNRAKSRRHYERKRATASAGRARTEHPSESLN
jgi:predicted RNA-binding Zn ribbon-like protein